VTAPIRSVILKTLVTDLGSISLSLKGVNNKFIEVYIYSDFLLNSNDSSVFSFDRDSSKTSCFDSLEGIF